MNITLARIDDRLIHGQVTTVWSKVANAQRIIICNDDVYNDDVASPGRAAGHEGQCGEYRESRRRLSQPAISGRNGFLFIH